MKKPHSSVRFVMHELPMVESPAWRSLSREGRMVLERIEIEHMRRGGQKNGGLVVTYADFEAYGIGHCRVIARGIREVEALGFVEIIKGRAGAGAHREASQYRLTYLPTNGQPPTNEWRKFATMDDARAQLQSVKRRRKQSPWFCARTAETAH